MGLADITFATLVGGGPCEAADINLSLTFAPYLVGVDSGADRILAAGLMPDRVYGDMDSLSQGGGRLLQDRMAKIDEQVTTDFDKALRSVPARLCIAVGFSGGRLDHELAVLNALARNPSRPCIVVGAETLTFLCPPELDLQLPSGTLFSLYPMAPVQIASQGLRWPTDDLAFSPVGRIGTSNAVEGRVTLVPDGPAMLVILPRDCLAVVFAAVDAAPRWPEFNSSAH